MIKKFKIIQCPKCGHIQVMGGWNFKCKICNKGTKIRLKSKYGLHLKLIESFDTGLEAQKFISKFNEERLKDKFQGFKSYEAKEKMNKFVGICTYCREDIYEEELQIYDGKPFHKGKKCIEKHKEIGKVYQ